MQLIHKYGEVFGPKLYLDSDNPIVGELSRYVTRFEFIESEKKASQVHIVLANPELKWIYNTHFWDGLRLRVVWGYMSDLSSVVSVTITKAAPTFPASDMPTLELAGFDVRFDIVKGTKPKNWGQVTSSEVARKIAERYGFDTDIEDSKDSRKQSRVQPANTADIPYLLKLAKPLGWDCYIDGKVLHFHPQRYSATPVLTFNYTGDPVSGLLSFAPKINMHKPNRAGYSAADAKHGKGHTSTAGSEDDGNPKAGQFVMDWGTKPGENIIKGTRVTASSNSPYLVASPETDKKVTDLHAKGLSNKIDMSALKATMVTIGMPKLRARTMVRVLGVGKALSGNWRITEVHHKMAVGSDLTYTVTATLARNALGAGTKKAHNKNDKESDGFSPTQNFHVAFAGGGVAGVEVRR